ncbi:hypothetical protein [Aquimarina spongiae]|uniref:SbsA Ig-like domain-containing protein n=1 Tax=Aquimarina spongiae TaxID=570521 RepID=A0A1M6AXH4_9FLAO|nr:hypothetical protein [Aquimarina spongiae]SHI41249.1 hypothetical protein SAMN04488508_101530 [Aquimarina spongiae]
MRTHFKKALLLLLFIICSIPEMFSQASPEFSFSRNHVIIKGIDDSNKVPKIYRGHLLEEEITKTRTAILGKTIQEKGRIRFTPFVPFNWEQDYTIVYNRTYTYFHLKIPDDYQFISVKGVYPSADEVPANLLKWYVQFSKPINETAIYDHIHFLNRSGDTIPRAVLDFTNALISEDSKLLTVWIEPGRQKRDLIPNQELGPVFEEGKTYTLVISGIKDQAGVQMKDHFTKQFQVAKADRQQPDIHSWKITPPKRNTQLQLIIDCKESLDYGSTIESMQIVDSNNNLIEGNWQFSNKESTLSFNPLKKWNKESYTVFFNPKLEDLAGNNLDRLFDRKVGELSSSVVSEYSLNFKVQ